MIEAAGGLVPIMVDCSKGGDKALQERYGVQGYPTVVFTDPEGKQVEQLGARDPASVRAQILRVIEQHSSSVFADTPVEEGLAQAREASKLLAVLFTSDKKLSQAEAIMAAVTTGEDLAELRDRFVWLVRPAKDGRRATEEAEALKVRDGGILVVLDPRGEKELTERSLGKSKSARSLKRTLEKALEETAQE